MIATTLVTILRGVTADDYGDEIDDDVAVYTAVPASILERRVNPRRPVDGRTDQERGYTLRVRRSVELRTDDRVRDERTGVIYTIDSVTNPTNPVGHAVTSAVLRRVT